MPPVGGPPRRRLFREAVPTPTRPQGPDGLRPPQSRWSRLSSFLNAALTLGLLGILVAAGAKTFDETSQCRKDAENLIEERQKLGAELGGRRAKKIVIVAAAESISEIANSQAYRNIDSDSFLPEYKDKTTAQLTNQYDYLISKFIVGKQQRVFETTQFDLDDLDLNGFDDKSLCKLRREAMTEAVFLSLYRGHQQQAKVVSKCGYKTVIQRMLLGYPVEIAEIIDDNQAVKTDTKLPIDQNILVNGCDKH